MKAIVQDTHGSPDVLQLTEIDKPLVGEGEALGAEVTGVCSTRNLELIRSLGATPAAIRHQDHHTRGPRALAESGLVKPGQGPDKKVVGSPPTPP